MRRPLACGQLCRPEVGVPRRPVPSARMAVSLPRRVIRGSSDSPPAGLRPAVPTGGRRSLAAGVICTNGAVFALPRHAGGAAMRRPLACGQLCRPEVGVPRRPVPSARMALSPPRGVMRGSSDAPPAGLRPAVPGPIGRTAQRSAFQAVPALFWRGGVLPSAQKTMAANSVRCLRDRGESVKGGPPFHKSTMTNRNSPPRAAGAQGSFDCRREAPGGPRTGPQLQAELRPKAIPDQGPVRGPLDPVCRSETGAPSSPAVPRIGGRRYPPGRPSPAGGRISPLWRFERPSFSWVGDCSWSHWPGS